MDIRIAEQRRAEVTQAVGRIRSIMRAGLSRDALERIKPELVDLAARSALFPKSDFPMPPETDGVIYRLSEDADHRFALFASVGLPGKARAIHNHTTWAVIAGVYGLEHNICYERVDDGLDPAKGALRRTGEITVRPGNAVAMMPNDFHSIEVMGTEPSIHLHMYGMSHAYLPNRIGFNDPEGGPVQRYPLSQSVGFVDVAGLRTMLDDGVELALIDSREEGVASRDGHILLASILPLSHVEMRAPVLMPRKSVRIVVCDGNEGSAQLAAARLMKYGYTNVSVLEGGTPAWAAAGHRLYTGINVVSKAFGEYVEHAYRTPNVSAVQVQQWRDAGKDVLVLDSRPRVEYERMRIPGGIDCPGAELAYRGPALIPSADTVVVVNCAGRTRSIVGAQSLINAGVKNEVYALRDGTMGWHLAGLSLDRGPGGIDAPHPSFDSLRQARQGAAQVALRFGVKTVAWEELSRWRGDEARSLFLFDVRSPEEYEQGHLPGFRSAPGGQLVQTADNFSGVRNATLVLADSDGVRATMSASWLIQSGWSSVFVINIDDVKEPRLIGPETRPAPLALDRLKVDCISAIDLKSQLDAGAVDVVDLENSLRYRESHIPGAWHAVRSRLDQDLPRINPAPMRPLVFTSPDGVLALYAARDAVLLGHAGARALAGGTASWKAAGLPLEAGTSRMTGPADDIWYRAHEQLENVEAAMQAYLAWEIELMQAVQVDPDFHFLAPPASGGHPKAEG